MNVYIVSFSKNYPGANEIDEELRTETAFVLAESFRDAEEKTEKRFKGEYESVTIRAISTDDKTTIIV